MKAAAYDDRIKSLFAEGLTDSQIAGRLGLTKGQVVGRRHRLGVFREGAPDQSRRRGRAINRATGRPVITETEAAERRIDLRDLEILSDLADGHSVKDVARFYSVDPSYITAMHEEADKE